jgi:hypothetical protein
MTTEREVQETIARCVSALVCYYNGRRTQEETTTMAADIRSVADWVSGLGWAMGETDERILRPVEKELLDRYGHELGVRLTADFLKAYEGY